jgi:restriction system protein
MHQIEIAGGRRRDSYRVVRVRRRSYAKALPWLALLGWFAWHQAVIWEREHSVGVNRFLSIALPSFVALLLGLVALILRVKAGRRRREALEGVAQVEADRSLSDIYIPGNDGSDFEERIARVLRRDGLADVVRSGGSGDFGSDVRGWECSGSPRLKVVVQCKNYSPDAYVGSQDVQRFGGTVWTMHGAHIAVFATTAGRFSAGAKQAAAANGIYLIAHGELGTVLAGDPLIPANLVTSVRARLAGNRADTAPLPDTGLTLSVTADDVSSISMES